LTKQTKAYTKMHATLLKTNPYLLLKCLLWAKGQFFSANMNQNRLQTGQEDKCRFTCSNHNEWPPQPAI